MNLALSSINPATISADKGYGHAEVDSSRIDRIQAAKGSRLMIVRARMMLKCPGCDETKLMSVTIIDDVAGPAMCDACIARALTERRHANHVSLAARLALPAPR